MMLNITELKARLLDLENEYKEARVCQEILLNLFSKSKYKNNFTIKGGVLMRNISKNERRATLDIDIDFIKYPITDAGVKSFINELNGIEGIRIKIIGKIENLKHQDYKGKRINIKIIDSYGASVVGKIDIGVHKQLFLIQDDVCFDLMTTNESVSFLANSKEQVFTEKLKSLLRLSIFTTRFKDIYDMYYLIPYLDKERLLATIDILIYQDTNMKEKAIEDVVSRINKTFKNNMFKTNLSTSKKNWLSVSNDLILESIVIYLTSL